MEGRRIDLLIDVCPFTSVHLPATRCETWWELPSGVGRGGESELIALDDMAIVNYSLLGCIYSPCLGLPSAM